MYNLFLEVFMMIIVLTGQSNMDRSADEIAALMPGYTVVNCAKKSTSIVQWQRGTPYYDNCLSRIGWRVDAGGQVVGIFFFQGEGDTDQPESAPIWDVLAKQFFDDFRADLGDENIPIVYAQLGPKPANSPRLFWGTVQIRQGDLFQVRYPNISMIRTKDITPYCSSAHWCDEGQLEIAHRFIDRFFEMLLKIGT